MLADRSLANMTQPMMMLWLINNSKPEALVQTTCPDVDFEHGEHDFDVTLVSGPHNAIGNLSADAFTLARRHYAERVKLGLTAGRNNHTEADLDAIPFNYGRVL
jgi:hypothetical protein